MISVFAITFWLAVGLLLYHHIGYPVLLALAVRVLARPIRRGGFSPMISVIIPAYNEGGVIGAKLASVLNGRYPDDRMEVIVVDDGSTDDTAEQVSKVDDPRVILDHGPERRGKVAALNRAVKRARGEVLVFSDANALMRPDTLTNLMCNFADSTVGCVSGRTVTAGHGSELETGENLYWRLESCIKTLESRLGSSPAADGSLLAVRGSVYDLPSNRIVNDDFQMAVRTVHQGYRAVYDRTAVTAEEGSASLADEFGRKSRIAAGRWQVVGQVLGLVWQNPGFVFKFVSHKLLRLLVGPLMLLAFVSNLCAVILNRSSGMGLVSVVGLHAPWGHLALVAQVAFYALAGMGALLNAWGLRFKPAYLVFYFLSAHMASMVGMVRFFLGRQTVLWRKVAR
jgi:cellulose synthase/poly-beta-1,6-N-acetylglucosamine synthase-like glycosyltransferase